MRLKHIATNKVVNINLETATPGTVVRDFDGKEYTYDYRRGWLDEEGHMVDTRTVVETAEWVVCDSSILYPDGYTEMCISVWV